jgi:predicted O-linked N-acetylglucosamine transferase (SPINDLY family)
MEVLKKIHQNLNGKIVYRFFPKKYSVGYDAIVNRIRAWIPEAEVMHVVDYQQYIEWLSECDIVFQSFPFGGTNTTIEAFTLGIPVVCLSGHELHSSVDREILKAVGVDSQLLANDQESFIQICTKLVENVELRHEIGQKARSNLPNLYNQLCAGKTFGEALHEVVN